MSLAKCLKKLKIDSSHEDSIISGLASLTEQGNLERYRKATLALDQAMNDTLDEQEDIHIQLEKQGYSFKEDNSVKDSKLLEEKLNKQGYTFTITPKNVRDFVAKDKTREAQATTATKLASKFGKRITWIDAKGDFGINGVVVPNIKDVIFLDVNTKYPAHAVMGHELSHHLEYDKPDVYKDLVASMEGLLKNHKEYADKYKIEGASHKDIVKEMIGDIMGDNFTKQDFWNKLADQDRSLFTKIADTIKAWLEQFIKSDNLGSDAFVKDVKKAREVIALAVAKYRDVQQPTQSAEAKFSRTPKSLDAVEKSWDSKGIASSMSERNGIITLNKIVVPKDSRNAGKGTAAMRELTNYADTTNQQIALTPSADFGGNKVKLQAFYKRFGFRKNNEFNVMESMIRDPESAKFSRAPKLYSKLEQALEAANDKVFSTGSQVKLWLQSNAGKLGIKKDEIYWSGIDNWLDAQGKVSKQQVVEFVRNNGVQVEDVTLGVESAELLKRIEEIDARTREISLYPRDANTAKNESDQPELDEISAEWEMLNDKLYLTKSPKHNNDKLTLSGGTDYKELVVTIPTIEKYNESDSTHFGDTGQGKQIGWLRMNTRDGGLFIEELQSQRAQQGRSKGFFNKDTKFNLEARREELIEKYGTMNLGGVITAEERAELDTLKGKIKAGIPPAPFVSDANNKATNAYITLLMKKALIEAVSNDHASVSWTTGDQQADRYDLSKQIERIYYKDNGDDTYDLLADTTSDSDVTIGDSIKQAALPDYVGKEIAHKIINAEGVPAKYNEGYTMLKGVDLKTGGEWAQSMYGNEQGLNLQGKPSLISQAANDIFKHVGSGKVESINGQPGFYVTPEMRSKDLPLFSRVISQDSEYLDAVNSGDMEKAQKLVNDKLAIIGAYWHGTPSGDLRGGMTGLHVGTKQAAMEALEARIGIPADGRGWDGTREYGKTLLAGRDRVASGQFGKYRDSGYNIDSPKDDFYAEDHELPTVGNDVKVDPSWKPWIRPVLIVGDMDKRKKTDSAANSLMYKLLSQGKATRGFYYKNDGEDAGSVSAVLPNGDHVKIKLPDAVTYDDEGNVIPLSERFNKDNNDIRFSRAKPVTVNGVDRPATNSEGKLIPNPEKFYAWFKDSSAVDKFGRPLVLYHGTRSDINSFDPKTSGSKSKTGAPEGTFFFADDKRNAESYTVSYQGDFSREYHDGGNVMPVYLSIQKPLVINAKNENWNDILFKGEYVTINDIAEYAKNSNKESLIVKNVRDKGIGDAPGVGNVYIAFSPSQIKSALGNSGEFSSSSDDIRFSREAIKINGVDRPTTNSEGKAIHPTQEGISNFWKWFGDSKVVDEDGRPYVFGGFYLKNNKKPSIPKKYKEALLAGERLRQKHKDIGVYRDMSVHEMRKDDSFGGDKLEQIMFELGWRGYSLDELPATVAFRIGDIPKTLISKDFASGVIEYGVSVVDELTQDNQNTESFYDLMLSQRGARQYVAGFRNPYYDGADGEPLLLFPIKIDGGLDAIKSSLGNSGEFSSSSDDIRFSRAKPVTVDGIERPTTNSEGKQINNPVNFWKWFGDSKAYVSPTSSKDNLKMMPPLVFYHGTKGDFNEFKVGSPGVNSNVFGNWDTTRAGIFFTEDKKFAESFSVQGDSKQGANVIPVYLKAENPIWLTEGFEDSDIEKLSELGINPRLMRNIQANQIWGMFDKEDDGDFFVSKLKEAGYDSAIIIEPDQNSDENVETWVVFDPNQIKSAIGNNGEYSSANNDIRFSKEAIPEETTYQKSQRTVQDKFNRFSVIRDWLKERGVKLTELSNVYDAEERYHAKVANQLEDFREKVRNPLIEKIAKAGFTLSDVQDFLLAQHASEANKQIQKVRNDSEALAYGVTDKEASEYLSKAKPELATLANELRDVTEQAKQLRLDAGILNKDITDNWDNTYKHYIPVKGDESIQGTGKGLNVKHKDKRRLGHEKRNEAVIENILMDYERAVMEVEKNRVGKYLVMFAAEANNPDLITVGQPEKRNILKENNSYAIVDSDGVIHSVYVNKIDAQRNAPKGSSIQKISDPRVIAQASPMLAPNEVNVYMDGHAIRVQLNDDLLARAYANMGVESVGAIVEAGRVLNSYLSKVYTGYNPEFIVTNIIRDFTSGIVNLTGEEGTLMAVKAIGNYPKMFADLFRYAITRKSTELIDSYRANGGNTGAAYLSDMERLGKEISREYVSYQGVIANIKAGDGANAFRAAGRKVFNSTLKWIEHLNQAGENAMRLAAYKAMLDSGKTVEQASKVAKNITVNFNRRGEIGQTANALYLFFNASVQGSAAVLHANLRGNHKYQANALAVGMASLGYMLAAGLGGMDEEEYDKIDGTTKERNLIIGSGDSYVKIPIPYGYGFFFNTGRVIADAQRKGEFGKAPFRMAVNAVEELTPFGNLVNSDEINSEQVVGGVAPTALQIPYQMSTNTSLFTGKEIRPVSPFDSSQPEREQMFRNTKGTVYDDMAGLLSNAGFDVSPENIKFLTRTLTGGAGALVDTAVSSSKLKAQGVELDIKEMPFIRKFAGENTISNDRSAYYKAVEEATKAAEEFSRARKNNDISSMKKIMEDKRELLAMDKYANKLRKVIKLSRDMQDSVRLNEDIPIAEKRLKLKELETQESKTYERYLDVYKARVK